MSVKPITDSLPLSCKGEETILLKQIAQNTQSAAQAARQQLLLSKIRLGLTGGQPRPALGYGPAGRYGERQSGGHGKGSGGLGKN